MGDKKLDYLLDVAIQNEVDAYNFYMELHKKMTDPQVKETLKFLADQETKHKEFLEKYKKGGFGASALTLDVVIDYKIAEHAEKPDLQKNLDSKDVYLVAANKELNSYNFYKSLSDVQPAGEVKDMLLKMANEELKHKEKVEYLYSNSAFPQTAGG
ncbi:MAG TPA: ferritin family protein [Spirochaetota bacterium]|nr:ferritin family protein [Spirochaetota bacterium]